ncbi:MAG: alcohol dehydrogenase catalytic domain-containing protein, partial [Caldisericum sp.]|uniref:alcohol dehydrogenase catalytic domain-containing protein n=1 Tax=Caldisericum sp. TaxID=2499687 RepID=UPI003D0DD205
MKALVVEKPGQVSIKQIPDPMIQTSEDVIIKVDACGICGTDVHLYHGLEFASYPRIPGHEFVGTIIDVGSEA